MGDRWEYPVNEILTYLGSKLEFTTESLYLKGKIGYRTVVDFC